MLIKISRKAGHRKPEPMHVIDSDAVKAELQAAADLKAGGPGKGSPVSDAEALAEARKRAQDYVDDHEGAAGDPPAYEMLVSEEAKPAPAAPAQGA